MMSGETRDDPGLDPTAVLYGRLAPGQERDQIEQLLLDLQRAMEFGDASSAVFMPRVRACLQALQDEL